MGHGHWAGRSFVVFLEKGQLKLLIMTQSLLEGFVYAEYVLPKQSH